MAISFPCLSLYLSHRQFLPRIYLFVIASIFFYTGLVNYWAYKCHILQNYPMPSGHLMWRWMQDYKLKSRPIRSLCMHSGYFRSFVISCRLPLLRTSFVLFREQEKHAFIVPQYSEFFQNPSALYVWTYIITHLSSFYEIYIRLA